MPYGCIPGHHHSGAFNFTKSVYNEDDYEAYMPLMAEKYQNDKELAKDYFKNHYRTRQMSDHLPLWVELRVDFSARYLNNLKSNIEKGQTYNNK